MLPAFIRWPISFKSAEIDYEGEGSTPSGQIEDDVWAAHPAGAKDERSRIRFGATPSFSIPVVVPSWLTAAAVLSNFK
jgi:hypothetical protein